MRTVRHDLRMMAAAATVIFATALSGCFVTGAPPAPVASAPPQPLKQVDVKPICGKVKEFTPAEEKALGEAVTALDKDSPIIAALGDYKRMRDEARACKNFK